MLVIGGSSGIGFEVARAALRFGAVVTIASHEEPSLRDARRKMADPTVKTRLVDTFDNASIETLFAGQDTYQHVVVTAAWSKVGSVHELSLEDAYKSMESKFWGSYKVARAARFAENGSLTLVSGNSGTKPDPHATLQSALNAAMDTLVRALALDLAPTRVNAVSPGLINTPLWATLDTEKRNELMEDARRRSPVRRVGEPADVAAAILLAMVNPYMTGTIIVVDGGASLT